MGTRITPGEHRLAPIARTQLMLVTRRQALDCGCTVRLIERRLASGMWLARYRGVYASRDAEPSAAHMALAAVLAVGVPAAASGRTAAALWGFDGARPPTVPEVITRHQRHLRPAGVALRRSRTLSDREIVRIGPVPVTTASRTLLDLAAIVGSDRLEDMLDAAIRQHRTSARDVLTTIARAGSRGIVGVGLLRALAQRRVGRQVSGSAQENRLRRVLARAGLPPTVSQHVVRDGAGRFIGRVDEAYPDRRLAFEYDSFAEHTGRTRYARDVRRRRRLRDAGWEVVPVMAEDLEEGVDDFMALVVRIYHSRVARGFWGAQPDGSVG